MAGSVLVTYLHVGNLGFCPDWWKILKFRISCFPLKGINNSKGFKLTFKCQTNYPTVAMLPEENESLQGKTQRFYFHTNRFFPPKTYLAISIIFRVKRYSNISFLKNRSFKYIFGSNHLGLYFFSCLNFKLLSVLGFHLF